VPRLGIPTFRSADQLGLFTAEQAACYPPVEQLIWGGFDAIMGRHELTLAPNT
jgi:hypothetical protein